MAAPEALLEGLESRYRFAGKLGEGGMATVHLAHDLKHDRKVAIKVLKPELAAVIGAERFLAEIRTTANLQHPHILPLFDSGEAGGFLYYVMPFVDGESLRDRIDRDKQLPVDEAVSIAVGVASALEHAHGKGVIHRDIKPANILLQDGQPVVADFGIALAVQQAASGRMTETGLSLGTPHYMSPEQASADRDLSAQSDVYALACVVYEMLTGGPPFAAPTAQAILMQILTEDPDPVTKVRRTVPPHVEAAIAKALEKLPADRFATAAAFADALKNPGSFRAVTRVASSGARGGVARWGWPAGAVAMAGLAAWGWLRAQPVVETRPVHFRVETGTIDSRGVIEGAPIAISADGSFVAFLSYGDGAGRVYVREFASLESRLVYEGQPIAIAISTDNQTLYVRESSRITAVPFAGGPSRIVVEDASTLGTVTPMTDGSLLYTNTDAEVIRWRDGAESSLIPNVGDDGVVFEVSESGDAGLGLFATYTAAGQAVDFGVIDLETGERTVLGQGTPLALRDGILVWESNDDETIIGQRIDLTAIELQGSPIVLLQSALLAADMSDTGDLVYLVASDEPGEVIRVTPEDGVQVATGIDSGFSELGVRVSPDGRLLAFDRGFSDGTPQVFVAEIATGVVRQVTFDGGIYPGFDLTGERITYYRVEDGVYSMYARNADGSGTEELLLTTGEALVDLAFIPGSDKILVREGDQARLDGSDIARYAIGDPASREPIAVGPGNQLSPVVSPNGRFVAYSSNGDDTFHRIFVRSLENPSERWPVSPGAGEEPLWSPDGDALYYRAGRDVFVVPVDTDSETFRQTGSAEVAFFSGNLVANRNRTSYSAHGGDLYFLSTSPASMNVILNWWDEVLRQFGVN